MTGKRMSSSKDRVLTAVNLAQPDRVPMDFLPNPWVAERLHRDLGTTTHRELLERLHGDIVDLRGVVDPAFQGPVPLSRELGDGVRETDRICLHGGICTQYLLPNGTPDEVREEVRRRVRILGAGGGYILAPCHVLQTDVPTENILAMSDAGMEAGRYA